MSSAFKCFLAGLFGSEECSDCVVRFCLSKDVSDRCEAQPMEDDNAAEQPAGAREANAASAADGGAPVDATAIGEPLPAHSWVLRPGSSFFKSQLERWTAEQPAGSKPVLKVPVGCAEDVGHALAAIRYIYTGKLSVSSAADLLGARRLACYLGVEGATEACNAGLLSISGVNAKPPSMAGVVELFACRHLLPAWDDDPTAAALVDGIRSACQERLAAYKGAVTEFTMPGGDVNVPLGELLAWAFCGAPSVLSDPAADGRVGSLSAAALEALLNCDAFATDNEASVLLLLAEWLDANPSTADDVKKRLCGCIRLCQLSDVYLHGVLPRLQWFPLSAPELPLLFQALKMPEGKGRERLLACVAESGYIWPAAWISGAPRPRTRGDAGRTHEWSIAKADLGTALRKLSESDPTVWLTSNFASGADNVISNGFALKAEVEVNRDLVAAGVYLVCSLPASLKLVPWADRQRDS
ncbi:hypothetical protein HYH03_003145 [Edaphochlamys debaryana]|uniref:BTB domain-containing protein n=1 Tax=Edaphochlamys debaryana TaxID=47281 RepID=A0A836C3M3_9CHLO|nr:hypothetical protein HYH03_003145 [Edaphochlamys debaryana]|eukprot:KAG2498955.1 hypothetical protein HYH03_003145 [Edaphochlamys debaryana]